MAKLPQITAQTAPSGQLSAGRLSSTAFGGDSGLRQLGQGVAKLGGVIKQNQERRERLDARKAASNIRLQWTEQLNTAMSESQDGADGFTDDFSEFLDKSIDRMRPEFKTQAGRQAYQQQVDDLKVSFLQKSITFQAEAAKDKAIGDYKTLQNEGRNTLLNDPSQFESVLNDQLGYIEDLAVPGNAKRELATSAKRELSLSAIQSEIGIDADNTEKELRSGKWDKYIDADDKARFLAQINSTKSANKSQATAALRSVEDRMREGLEIPEEEMSGVNAVIMGNGDPETMKRWGDLVAVQKQNNFLRALRPSDVQAYINNDLAPRVNKDGATGREFELFQSANKMLGTMRTEIQRDPLTWAARTGAVQLNSVFEPGGWGKRKELALRVSDYYGTETNPLTAAETSELAQRLKDSSPKDQLKQLQDMIDGLGDLAPDALSALDQEDGTMAHAAALTAIAPESHTGVALQILQGNKILRDNPKSSQLLGGDTGATTIFREETQGAFRNTPRIANSVRSAANALYVQMATQNGETQFDADLYEQAMSLALGGNGSDSMIDKRNGSAFILPPGMNDNQFDTFMENLTPEYLTEMSDSKQPPKFEDGTIATPEQIADEGRLHFIGNGRYLVTMHDGGYLLGGGPNGYYVLNVDPDQVVETRRREIDAAPLDFGIAP